MSHQSLPKILYPYEKDPVFSDSENFRALGVKTLALQAEFNCVLILFWEFFLIGGHHCNQIFKSEGFADLQALLIILYFFYAVFSPVVSVDNTDFWRVLSRAVKL